jgi:hypothetical protein
MRTLAGFGQHLAGGNPCTAYGGNTAGNRIPKHRFGASRSIGTDGSRVPLLWTAAKRASRQSPRPRCRCVHSLGWRSHCTEDSSGRCPVGEMRIGPCGPWLGSGSIWRVEIPAPPTAAIRRCARWRRSKRECRVGTAHHEHRRRSVGGRCPPYALRAARFSWSAQRTLRAHSGPYALGFPYRGQCVLGASVLGGITRRGPGGISRERARIDRWTVSQPVARSGGCRCRSTGGWGGRQGFLPCPSWPRCETARRR